MQTVSVNIENLCVPCHCGCRHCLLSSQHRTTGVPYDRGEAFARRFYDWLRVNRPDLNGMFYVGYCMDFPELPRYIGYLREQTGMEHLLFDGLGLRREADAAELIRSIFSAGTREISLTLYGAPAYHDRFAGRQGDFDYLMLLGRLAAAEGLRVSVGIMLTQENMDQMPALFEILNKMTLHSCTIILPHAKGRGEGLSHLRITARDYEMLCPEAKAHFPRHRYQTEAEWLQTAHFPKAEQRHLTLALMPENIDHLEQMDPAQIIRELEEMDDAYYTAIPTMEELAKQYGRPGNQQLFRLRDLYLQWQKRYLAEHPITVADMNDERHSFSVRI